MATLRVDAYLKDAISFDTDGGYSLDVYLRSAHTYATTGNHALTADGITVGAPVLGTPAITQDHVVTANGITVGAPALGTPALTQNHALTANGITVGAPTLGTPTLAIDIALTANGLTVGAPTLGTPALTQDHVLAAAGITVGAPVLGNPVLSEESGNHELTADGITVGAPVLGTPALTEVAASIPPTGAMRPWAVIPAAARRIRATVGFASILVGGVDVYATGTVEYTPVFDGALDTTVTLRAACRANGCWYGARGAASVVMPSAQTEAKALYIRVALVEAIRYTDRERIRRERMRREEESIISMVMEGKNVL
jgi:hypothetical protein